jgi:hypothetical protein
LALLGLGLEAESFPRALLVLYNIDTQKYFVLGPASDRDISKGIMTTKIGRDVQAVNYFYLPARPQRYRMIFVHLPKVEGQRVTIGQFLSKYRDVRNPYQFFEGNSPYDTAISYVNWDGEKFSPRGEGLKTYRHEGKVVK